MEEIPSLLDVGIYTGLPSGSSSDSFIIYSQGDSSFSQLSSFPVNIAGSERKGYVLTVSADNKYSASGEGTIYPLFSTTTNRIKGIGAGGAAAVWWLRSPTVGGSFYFVRVEASGGVSGHGSSGAFGVAPGFCV